MFRICSTALLKEQLIESQHKILLEPESSKRDQFTHLTIPMTSVNASAVECGEEVVGDATTPTEDEDWKLFLIEKPANSLSNTNTTQHLLAELDALDQ